MDTGDDTMDDYTVMTRNGFLSVNGHGVKMTAAQARKVSDKMLADFPDSVAAIYQLCDQELVGVAYEWGSMSDSMEKALGERGGDNGKD